MPDFGMLSTGWAYPAKLLSHSVQMNNHVFAASHDPKRQHSLAGACQCKKRRPARNGSHTKF
jgi:hypothetical protein